MTFGGRLIGSVAPLALLIACGVAAAGSLGAGDHDEGAVVLASQALGSVSITNSLGGGAILSAPRLAPGGSTWGQLTITNSSSSPAAFSLVNTAVTDTAGLSGGLLSQRLQLEVTDLSAPDTVYDGPLALLGTRQLRRFEPGEARVYRFKATLPEGGLPPSLLTGDNAYQAASVNSAFVWTATALEGPSGGGGSGTGTAGGDSGSTASDSPLVVRVSLLRRQPPLRKRRLVFKAACNRRCSFTARAKMTGRAAHGASTKSTHARSAATNRSVKLSLRMSPRAARAMARALRGRGGAGMSLVVNAHDSTGHRKTLKRGLRLQQLRRHGRTQLRASWDRGRREQSQTRATR